MQDSDDPDLAAGNTVDEVVGIASEDEFARGTRFGYSSQQRKANEQLSLLKEVIGDLFCGDRII